MYHIFFSGRDSIKIKEHTEKGRNKLFLHMSSEEPQVCKLFGTLNTASEFNF